MAGHSAFGLANPLRHRPKLAVIRSNESQNPVGFTVVIGLEDNAFRAINPGSAHKTIPFVKRIFWRKIKESAPFQSTTDGVLFWAREIDWARHPLHMKQWVGLAQCRLSQRRFWEAG